MKTPPGIQENSDGVTLSVWVKPKASRNRCQVREGRVELSVTSPPADGEANDAVCRLLSETLGVSRSRIEIQRGHSSRQKQIAIAGLSAAELAQRLGLG